uniref:Putative secreted protein n=1 Tax=Anopheles triannulatus TaxID=58253 RepID=A0A2M4B6S4_9DIPT
MVFLKSFVGCSITLIHARHDRIQHMMKGQLGNNNNNNEKDESGFRWPLCHHSTQMTTAEGWAKESVFFTPTQTQTYISLPY